MVPEFTAFLQPFEWFFDPLKLTRHVHNYTRGVLSVVPRKTAELSPCTSASRPAGMPVRLARRLRLTRFGHTATVGRRREGGADYGQG
jgi:hypothetical protein